MSNSLTQFKDHSTSDSNRLTATDVQQSNPLPVSDPWLSHAVAVIESTYGDLISVSEKSKDLLKFGTNPLTQTTLSTVMDLPSGVSNETYVSDNLITTISSSSTSDTEEIKIEYHTVDGNGDFTFGIQTITLTGQTQVTLPTPCARISRVYNNGSNDLVGAVYVYQDDTSTTGVPDTATKVHAVIPAGYNQTRKCATTVSSQDYWIITNLGCGMNEKTSAFADAQIEIRNKGKVFRAGINITSGSGVTADHDYGPYLIVPPNSDVRVRAKTGANNQEVTAHIQGVLAIIT